MGQDLQIETKAVRFEGNNYADEWRIEAENRGLPNLAKTPEALAWLVRPESTEFFHRMGIMQPEENEARYHVRLERYIKDIEIEIGLLKDLVQTSVLPAAYRQQALLGDSLKSYVEASKLAGSQAQWARLQADELEAVSGLIGELKRKQEAVDKKANEASAMESIEEKAHFYAYDLMEECAAVRQVCDQIEELVDDQFWPLPKYREMLFLG